MNPTPYPIQFVAIGDPKPQPRARSFILRGRGGAPILTKGGQPILRVHEAGTAEAWKQAVALAAQSFVPMPPMQGPVRVDIEFRFRRPKSHYRSNGEMKADAPYWYCLKRDDRDNLDKAVLDALTALGMWDDDGQVCWGEIKKVYAGMIVHPRKDELGRLCGFVGFNEPSVRPGATVTITPLTFGPLESNNSRTTDQPSLAI